MKRLLLLIMVLLLSGSVQAFKTYQLMGGEIHELITNEALSAFISMELLEAVDAGNTVQDSSPYALMDADHHFDDMRLNQSLAYVQQRWRKALELVDQESFYSACYEFGQLLHTTQDFYSHSNYVELNLLRGTPPHAIEPVDWKALPYGLRTGYFSLQEIRGRDLAIEAIRLSYPSTRFHPTDLHHRIYVASESANPPLNQEQCYREALRYVTGTADVLHLELNKDNNETYEGRIVHPYSGMTLHQIARQLAVKDTTRLWKRFLAEVEHTHGPRRGPELKARLAGWDYPVAAYEPTFPGDLPPVTPQPEPPPPPPAGPDAPPVAEALEEPSTETPVTGHHLPREPKSPEGPEEPLGPPTETLPEALPAEPVVAPLKVRIEGPGELIEGARDRSLRVVIEGGSGEYRWEWQVPEGQPPVPRGTPGFTHNFPQAATYRYSVKVWDSGERRDFPQEAIHDVRVYSKLSGALVAPATARVGSTIPLRAQFQGGKPSYTYFWKFPGGDWKKGPEAGKLRVKGRPGESVDYLAAVEDGLGQRLVVSARVRLTGAAPTQPQPQPETPVTETGRRLIAVYKWRHLGSSPSWHGTTSFYSDGQLTDVQGYGNAPEKGGSNPYGLWSHRNGLFTLDYSAGGKFWGAVLQGRVGAFPAQRFTLSFRGGDGQPIQVEFNRVR